MRYQSALSLSILVLMTSASALAAKSPICEARDGSLQHILDDQAKSDGETYKRGEWPSNVHLGGWAQKLGVLQKGDFPDRNIFVNASVHNILAEIYLSHTNDPRLLRPIQDASDSMAEYMTDSGAYNFWPRIPEKPGDFHAPRYAITSKTFSGLLSVPADADDTAVAQLAFIADRVICEKNHKPGEPDCLSLDPNMERQYTPFTDRQRMPAPSNLTRAEIMTGAYMTWLQNESFFPNWFKALGGAQNGQRIVLDKNDVDCVVNANVLRTLAILKKKDTLGYSDACRLLKSNAEDENYNYCGDYYPNTYWFTYSVSRAWSDGAECLEQPMYRSRKHLIEGQQADGSWKNDMLEGDEIQATAFALGALVKNGSPKDPVHVEAVRRGVNYLISKEKRDAKGNPYWSGGTFFTAGVPARYSVRWYSDAFTTSVVTLALFDLKNWPTVSAPCK